ncbi:MAG: acyl-CoA/acyl-ACP dehydrogenase [Desulfobacterales bacterium]|nr:acyl-CoA/acyl-ACP dehydrogenase [Desulfobacterales bacterium]
MELGFTKEQQIIRASARDFLKKECLPSMMREMRVDHKGFSSHVWKKMAELGWMGINIPEKYEGTGGDFIDLAILLESMGEVCCPGPFFSTVVLGGMTLLWAGSKSWKKKLLPKLADGRLILSMAWMEPGMGYGSKRMRTKIESRGEDAILTGTKLFVENAHICDVLVKHFQS